MKMKFKHVVATGIIATTLVSGGNIQAKNTTFSDVPKGHWAEQAINHLASKGIVSGYGSGKYGLGDHVTRGQAASLIARYLGIKSHDERIKFTDVRGHMFEESIKAVVQKGLMTGDSSTSFKPDNPLTRYEMAVILQKAFELPIYRGNLFHDVPLNHWAIDAVSALYDTGITSGIGGYNYGGNKLVTREEVAKFFYSAMNINPSVVAKPIPARSDLMYTGSQIANKMESFGFYDGGHGVYIYNKYGKEGDDVFDYAFFSRSDGGIKDMSLIIEEKDDSFNESLKQLLNEILPTQGDKLYSILHSVANKEGVHSQELEMDGRRVIVAKHFYTMIEFSPIQK
jgi:hypothetical protein